jgi:hypothetical protein
MAGDCNGIVTVAEKHSGKESKVLELDFVAFSEIEICNREVASPTIGRRRTARRIQYGCEYVRSNTTCEFVFGVGIQRVIARSAKDAVIASAAKDAVIARAA